MSFYGHQPRTSSLPRTAPEDSSGRSSPRTRQWASYSATRTAPTMQPASNRPHTSGGHTSLNVYQEVLDSPLIMTPPGFSSSARGRAVFQPQPISIPRQPRTLPIATASATSLPLSVPTGRNAYGSPSPANSTTDTPSPSVRSHTPTSSTSTGINPKGTASKYSTRTDSRNVIPQAKTLPALPPIDTRSLVAQATTQVTGAMPDTPEHTPLIPSQLTSLPETSKSGRSRDIPATRVLTPPPKDEQYLKKSPPRGPASQSKAVSNSRQSPQRSSPVDRPQEDPTASKPKPRRKRNDLPKLDVVIPDYGLDRFSVMFASVLAPEQEHRPPMPDLPNLQMMNEKGKATPPLPPMPSWVQKAPFSSMPTSSTSSQNTPSTAASASSAKVFSPATTLSSATPPSSSIDSSPTVVDAKKAAQSPVGASLPMVDRSPIAVKSATPVVSPPVSLSLFPHIPKPHSSSASGSDSRPSYERPKTAPESTSRPSISSSLRTIAFELEGTPVDPSQSQKSHDVFAAHISRPNRQATGAAHTRVSPEAQAQTTEATLFPVATFDISRPSTVSLPSSQGAASRLSVDSHSSTDTFGAKETYDPSEALLPLPSPTVPSSPQLNIHAGLTSDTRGKPGGNNFPVLAPAPLFHSRIPPNLKGLSALVQIPTSQTPVTRVPKSKFSTTNRAPPSASSQARSASGKVDGNEAEQYHLHSTYSPVMETASEMSMSRIVRHGMVRELSTESAVLVQSPQAPARAQAQIQVPGQHKPQLPKQQYGYQSHDPYLHSYQQRNATPTPPLASAPPPVSVIPSSTSSFSPYPSTFTDDYDDHDSQRSLQGAVRAVRVRHVLEERQRRSCGVEWGGYDGRAIVELAT